MSEETKPKFTVTNTVVRKGRGTHGRGLRTDAHEEEENRLAAMDSSTVLTGTTATVRLPGVERSAVMELETEEDRIAAEYTEKKEIPMDPSANFRASHFGQNAHMSEENDTLQQELFRGDRRRRYCIVIGNLQDTERLVNLKLFGHKGAKPFKLQNKLIRLVNLSIGKPRPKRDPDEGPPPADGEEAEGATKETEETPEHEGEHSEEHPEEEAEEEEKEEDPKKEEEELEKEPEEAAKEGESSEDEFDDIDAYMSRDVIAPLTVSSTNASLTETSVEKSPVLTSKFFKSLHEYFLNQLTHLMKLEDVRTQRVTMNISLGAAYCCMARYGSLATQSKHASFPEFIERMCNESMQMYFIKDSPICVLRAVDAECGSLVHEAEVTLVKIIFFSSERQGRTVARAVWDATMNRFRLLDMENFGTTLSWTVFSMDETDMMKKCKAASEPSRNKTAAYPFELEFRAFRRWKQQDEHPAAPLAHTILEHLSVAESNLINYGSSIGYERMDLTDVCLSDYASTDFNVESILVEHTKRKVPEGTSLRVDTTTTLYIENFEQARALMHKVETLGPEKTAALQNQSNNNYIRNRGRQRGRGRGRGRMESAHADPFSPESMEEALRPTSKLTFFKSVGPTIHWKLKPGASVEDNVAPIADALHFLQQVLHTANDIERSSARAGAGPQAL